MTIYTDIHGRKLSLICNNGKCYYILRIFTTNSYGGTVIPIWSVSMKQESLLIDQKIYSHGLW